MPVYSAGLELKMFTSLSGKQYTSSVVRRTARPIVGKSRARVRALRAEEVLYSLGVTDDDRAP